MNFVTIKMFCSRKDIDNLVKDGVCLFPSSCTFPLQTQSSSRVQSPMYQAHFEGQFIPASSIQCLHSVQTASLSNHPAGGLLSCPFFVQVESIECFSCVYVVHVFREGHLGLDNL